MMSKSAPPRSRSMKPKYARTKSTQQSTKPGTTSSPGKSPAEIASKIIAMLRTHANPLNVAGMARFGINPHNTLGVPIPLLRRWAKECGRNHGVEVLLWDSELHEARILAGMIDDAGSLTIRQMDRWTNQFD